MAVLPDFSIVYDTILFAMSIEDPNFSRGKFRFSAAEVADYLKKGQESQKEIDKLVAGAKLSVSILVP